MSSLSIQLEPTQYPTITSDEREVSQWGFALYFDHPCDGLEYLFNARMTREPLGLGGDWILSVRGCEIMRHYNEHKILNALNVIYEHPFDEEWTAKEQDYLSLLDWTGRAKYPGLYLYRLFSS